MTPEERELRRALEARTGNPSPDFRARVAAALDADKPAPSFLPALAAVAAAILVFATVGVLLLARQLHTLPPVGATSSPRLPTPSPTPGVEATPSPIALPSTAQLSASSGNVVWALVAGDYLARSTDGGITWKPGLLPAAEYAKPEISFVSGQEGWFTMGGVSSNQCVTDSSDGFWHTTDGGLSWDYLKYNGIQAARCKEHVSFVDSNRGFVDAWDSNHPPFIYRSTDGGRSWTASSQLPDPPGFTTRNGFTLRPGLVRSFGSTLLVTAVGPSNVQYVYRSTDGGATWAYLATSPNRNGGLALVTAARWLQLIAPGQSIETTDAGATWHAYGSDYSQAAPIAATFVFADPQVGYATVRGEISKTVDGGLHWETLHTPGT